VAWLQHLKPRIKVELIDPTTSKSCALGEICGVLGMTFHRPPISLRQCIVALTNILKVLVKLPFPN
jgi:hypothetical protein